MSAKKVDLFAKYPGLARWKTRDGYDLILARTPSLDELLSLVTSRKRRVPTDSPVSRRTPHGPEASEEDGEHEEPSNSSASEVVGEDVVVVVNEPEGLSEMGTTGDSQMDAFLGVWKTRRQRLMEQLRLKEDAFRRLIWAIVGQSESQSVPEPVASCFFSLYDIHSESLVVLNEDDLNEDEWTIRFRVRFLHKISENEQIVALEVVELKFLRSDARRFLQFLVTRRQMGKSVLEDEPWAEELEIVPSPKSRPRSKDVDELSGCCSNCLAYIILCIATTVNIFALWVVIPFVFSWKWTIFHFVLGNIETVFTLTSFVKTMTISPGLVSPKWDTQLDAKERKRLLGLELQLKNLRMRYCRHCRVPKPPRAHHSSTINRCVMRMDHYCVWVNNVVGLRNHKFFILFLFYMLIGILHFFVVAVIAFIQMAMSLNVQEINSNIPGLIIFVLLILFATFLIPMGLVVMMFLGWTLSLLVGNQTSVEHYKNSKIRTTLKRGGMNVTRTFRHVFDVGFYNNICTVLGKDHWRWLWPFSGVTEDELDGLRYQTIPEEEIDSFHLALRSCLAKRKPKK